MRCAALALLLAAAPAAAADRTRADLSCQPMASGALDYLCTIKLIDAPGGQPLDGITLTLGADMPSMPMAHNVAPVRAEPTRMPGVYQARLQLEMHGVWAVKLRLSGPRTDQLVRRLRFEPGAVTTEPR